MIDAVLIIALGGFIALASIVPICVLRSVREFSAWENTPMSGGAWHDADASNKQEESL